MSASRTEAIAVARKLVRTLPSAPDPRRQAGVVVATLAKAEGWSAEARREISDLAEWLRTLPPPSALRARCQQTLGKIS